MSSHHIIREKQEPALLVLGLAGFTDELLGQLLEWSPTLIATAATAELIHSMGIKFDSLIGDEASTDLQSDVKHIPLNQHTVEVAALDYLITNGYPAVNIIADKLDLDQYLPYANQINIVIFYNEQKIYPVTGSFSKWKPGAETIGILNPVPDMEVTGLVKTGHATYKTVADGWINLQAGPSIIFVAESII